MTSSLHVLEAQVDLVHRPLQLGQRARLVHPAVDQHDAVAGGDRPGVAVGDAGPRQWQAQPPEAGEHALAPAESRVGMEVGLIAAVTIR